MTKTRITLKNAKQIALSIDPDLKIDSYHTFRTAPKRWFVSRDNVKAIGTGSTPAAAWKAAAEALSIEAGSP